MWRWAILCMGVVACGSPSSGDDGDDAGGGIDASVTAPNPLTPDEAAKACVVFGSCMGDGINDCYTDAAPYWTTSEARCVLSAGASCNAVRACFGMVAVADPSCTTSSYTCDGTNLVGCGGGVRSTIACPDASLLLRVGSGSTCVPTSTGGALCGDTTCSAASATCTGSVASSCVTNRGVQMSTDCSDYAQSCVSGVCTSNGGGGACTAGTLPTCDGAAIVRCSGGIEVRTDCAAREVGAMCHLGPTTSPEPYCGPGDACYPTKGAETCTGTSVSYCAGGVVATADCTTLGFSQCLGGKCF
jgi:hypothetical protein